jgi:hypothetical protein
MEILKLLHRYLPELRRKEKSLMNFKQICWWIYEAGRFGNLLLGSDYTPYRWNERTPEWRRTFRARVAELFTLLDHGKPLPSPRQCHEDWVQDHVAMGWKYGPNLDPKEKTHPCMIPYDELPEKEKVKDIVFLQAVKYAWENLKKGS